MRGLKALLCGSFLVSSMALSQGARIECAHQISGFVSDDLAMARVCQGADYATITARAQCMQNLMAKTSSSNAALLCRGAVYANLTGIYDCFEREQQEIGGELAAELCSGATYRSYTTRLRCFEAAKDHYSEQVAAIICGGFW